jgi:hypothetical protein
MTKPEIMLEEFLSKCYTERQIPVQRSRWKKRIKLHTYCNDLKGSDLTLMNLFNYALSLYQENEQLKQQSIIAQPVDDKVVDQVDDKVVVKATLFSNYRNVEVQRIDTGNHNMGKLFKQEDIVIDEPTIVERPIVKEQTTEMIDDDSTHLYQDGVKIITSKKNPDIKPILRYMRSRINTFHIQVIMMKKSNTQQQISKWFNGKADAGNPKDILDTYKEITKFCRLSDELYKQCIEGAIKHIHQAFDIYMNNFENKKLDLRKR